MNLLALDTSANLCAVALYDCQREKILASTSEDIGRGHAERLMGVLAQTLVIAGLEYGDIGLIATTIGPGSFTGIRIGMATARGLALGLDIPVVGITVLEAIAAQHSSSQANTDCPLVVALDAKRGEVFMQVFLQPDDATAVPKAVVLDQLSHHLPDGHFLVAGSASNLIAAQYGQLNIEIISDQSTADIETVARLATQKKPGQKKPKPLYLRSADAKPQLNFAVKRINPVAKKLRAD